VNAGGGKRELTAALLRTQLFNTLGTPFLCTEAEALVDPGLHLASADIGQMRREALNRLAEKRGEPPIVRVSELPPLLRAEAVHPKPDLNFAVTRAAQLSEALAALKPRVLYVPLEELLREPLAVTPFWENGITSVCAVLPERYSFDEARELFDRLKQLKELQVTEVLVNSWNAVIPAGMMGFRIRCGLGLQVWNDWSLRVLKEMGAVSALLSPELTLEEIGSIAKCMDTELYAYGRLPLLTSEAPLTAPEAASDTLRDRRGRQFPVLNCNGRSRLYSPDKLFLGERLKDLEKLGLWCLHLAFTTENAGECLSAAERYLGRGGYRPNFKTRGLYYENETHSGFRFPAKKGASGNAGPVRSDDPPRGR
jgi:putative protease